MEDARIVQRQDLAHLLVTAMLSEPVTPQQAFGVLSRLGILSGAPEEPITRGELAEVLLRVLPL